MAYSQETAERIRLSLKHFKEDFTEKKMFGGLSFLYQSKMTVGIVREDLAVRVVASKIEEALKQKHCRPMDFTKTPMKEFIFVAPPGFDTEEQLLHWITLGLEHAKSKVG